MELAVAREIAKGHTNKEVGEALGISHRTVGTHLANAYKKLGIHGKVELASWLREHDRGTPA
jgi:DNA-binding CsgD family transcriptional regulator